MNRVFGFSLAEALITLLIVCIIVIMTMPMITKKAKKRPIEQPWSFYANYNDALYPSGHKDIILGEVSNGKSQSIVVAGRLEFKNRAGQTIGWIDEDGSSSFVGNNSQDYSVGFDYKTMMENQKKILTILNSLQQILQSGQGSTTLSGSSSNRFSRRSSSADGGRQNSSSAMSDEDIQKQIDALINAMNNNVYGR